MKELKKIKDLMFAIDEAINCYRADYGEAADKEKFYQLGCELKLMLYHEAESRLEEAMFYKD